jgi:Asp-tRNA(Asn)/Glu-tRNA(Gln) amidotransferase A subunit family amidase
MTIAEASGELRRGKISPVDLAEECLRKIRALNPELNAFITVTAGTALAEARLAGAEIARGNWRGPLHGIPIALKDNIDTAGVLTTAASNLFRNRVPNEDAEVVRRLKTAGAVFLGKTNLHEFAYGGSSVVSAYGAVRNHHRRLLWRFGGGSRQRHVPGRARHRHGWLRSRARGVLRRCRTQADLWPCEQSRRGPAFRVARSHGADHAVRG